MGAPVPVDRAARPGRVLALLTALAPLAMSLHVPTHATIAADLGAPVEQVQLAVPVFVLAFGVALAAAGVVVDRAGARRAMVAGLLLFVVGCALAAMGNLTALLVGRALAGGGAAFAIIVPRVLVAGVDRSTASASGLAYLAAVQAAVPALAPIVGAVLGSALGWRANFLVPALLGLSLVPAAWRLPRHSSARSSEVPALLLSRGILRPTLEAACVTAIFFALLGSSVQVLERPFALTATQVALVLGAVGLSFVVGSLWSARGEGAGKTRSRALALWALSMTALMLVGTSRVVTVAALLAYGVANGALVPAAFAEVARHAGPAKSVALGASAATQMLLGGLVSAVAARAPGMSPGMLGGLGLGLWAVVAAVRP